MNNECCEKCVEVEDNSGDGIGGASEYCSNPSCECHTVAPTNRLQSLKEEARKEFGCKNPAHGMESHPCKNGAVNALIEKAFAAGKEETATIVDSWHISKGGYTELAHVIRTNNSLD